MWSDHRLARALANDTGTLLLKLRRDRPRLIGRELGTAGDQAAHRFLIRALRTHRGDDAVLSEEDTERTDHAGARRVWIVDPLDGTREYGERVRSDWAVHVALVASGRPVAGAVALPDKGMVLGTDDPPRPRAASGRRLRVAVSRTHRPALIDRLHSVLDFEAVPMGSAGAKTAAVLTGAVDAYLHDGGQYEWDSAAPVAVALASRAHASRIDGSPLIYNQPSAYLPDLLVCQPDCRDLLLRSIAVAMP